MSDELLKRIERCESENQTLRRRLSVQTALLLVGAMLGIGGTALATMGSVDHAGPLTLNNGSITVKELVVVDDNNVVRARVGGNIPPAVIDGKTLSRGGSNNGVAGIMLYDRTGVERGGYITFDQGDNVALTLDNQKKQQVFFGVGPTGTASLQLWEGSEMLDLRADDNGARLTRTKAGVVAQQYPETSIKQASCQQFKSGIRDEVPKGLGRAEVKRICERRFSSEACAPCLPDAD
ncbi:hypothetical protein RF679_01390 [Undibacterium cyanobacteriorum]|uniref:FecR protein domain-containing protein n=1 Tax=Undibacterium cyanobacteriorum TaxID=3073561 RepID=A0ABY9RL06_9BURK|nr:hypothetical protein [Undibacterium sp. 20NA77.5]WMW80950.1 hypothetical protein RF679_01390 [Undibacterium sp. 20NA77.5]